MPMNTSSSTPLVICPHCQQQTPTTAYCAVCGQKKYESRFTWTYIVGEILSSLNFEKGILFNFKVLWQQPATALQGYLAGRTKLFYPPWQYFSVACGVFFFLLLTELTAMMGVNTNDDAEKAKAYYQEVYDKQYKDLAIFLQDSLLNYQNIDSIKNTLQKKGKELHDIRWLENDEDRRAAQQATFVQWFSYIGFYFFPIYLAFLSIFLLKLSRIILVLGNQHPKRCFFFAKTTYKDVIFSKDDIFFCPTVMIQLLSNQS
jgi:hypothetical protein